MNNFVVAHNQVPAWLATIDPVENKSLCENNSLYICSSIAKKKKTCCQGNEITEWFEVINYSVLSGTNGTNEAISTCLAHTSFIHCDWKAIQKLLLRIHLSVASRKKTNSESKRSHLNSSISSRKKCLNACAVGTFAKYETKIVYCSTPNEIVIIRRRKTPL